MAGVLGVGSQHTFIWQHPPTFDCPLQVVRMVIMHRQSGSTMLRCPNWTKLAFATASDQRSTLKLSCRVVEVFACPKVETTLQVTKHCYQDIPVTIKDQPDKDLFINIDTQVLRQSSPVRPCSGESPPK